MFMFFEEWEHLGYDLKGCKFKSQTNRLEAMLFQATFFGDYAGSIYARGNYEYGLENWTSAVDYMTAGYGSKGLVLDLEDRDQDQLRDMIHELVEFYSDNNEYPAFDEGWHEDWEYNTAVDEEMDNWYLPEFRKEVIDELDKLSEWGNPEELVPTDDGLSRLWYEYADEAQYYTYWEGATSMIIEGAPDPAEVAMGILEQYAKDITAAGNPPVLEGVSA